MDADEAELLALQEGVGNGRHAPPSADEPNLFDAPPCDPDDGYGDRGFLDEVCPGDVHLLTESERKKWDANRRLQ